MQQHRDADSHSRALNGRDENLANLRQETDKSRGTVLLAQRRAAHEIPQVIARGEAGSRAAQQDNANTFISFRAHQRVP
jgi:hypothetical protein